MVQVEGEAEAEVQLPVVEQEQLVVEQEQPVAVVCIRVVGQLVLEGHPSSSLPKYVDWRQNAVQVGASWLALPSSS